GALHTSHAAPLAMLLAPTLVWCATHSPRWHLAIATLALSASAISATSAGLGPFQHAVPSEAALQLQLFLLALLLLAHLLSPLATSLRLPCTLCHATASAAAAAAAAHTQQLAVLQAEVRCGREAVRAAGEGMRAAGEAKVQFMANMSHEIRTPLHAILAMTDLALDHPLPPDARDHLDTVLQSANHLLVLVDDILDITKLEAGRLQLDADQFDVRALINRIMTMLAARAASRAWPSSGRWMLLCRPCCWGMPCASDSAW
ncbi:hypothetical protein CLOP_g25708, partial [Closterium sp. NIES-67]